MGRIDTYLRELERPLRAAVGGRSDDPLRRFLRGRSGLPGPRANLELASVFVRALGSLPAKELAPIRKVCASWTRLGPEDAPSNRPEEFLVFCGTRGLGALGAAAESLDREVLRTLRALAWDPRWRVREAVAMALQDLLAARGREVEAALESWIVPEAWLEVRAVAAAVAEPRFLEDRDAAGWALAIHCRILREVASAKDRRSESFRVLRQAPGYSLSVVVAAKPGDGWPWVRELAESSDANIRWIVRGNLKKERLRGAFPKETEAVAERLVEAGRTRSTSGT